MLINAVVCIVFFYNFGIDAVNKLYECDIHATLIRQIKNDGFHRELHTNLELILGHSTVPWKQCRIILSENLPNSIYVNPNELNDLRRLSQNADKLNMPIPVGDSEHYMLVAAVTGLVAAGGCIYILSILASIWQYSK